MTRVAAFLRARIDDDERAILEEFERWDIRVIGETLSRSYSGVDDQPVDNHTPRAGAVQHRPTDRGYARPGPRVPRERG